ncbi:Z-DNA-binding protein 1 isoform X4 [Ranitomeya imitator]|uniref:Z-DNA-binding protein 1 isoform X4 n=1 Tax=Ranitomeya imitator TaxID=111125 RepID=UPI0037E7D434
MAENNETLITAKTRLSKIDCVLTDHQREIYHCLESNGPQTALSIAKAIKKKTTSEVNPHLYKMKAMNLLEQNSKVWSIKAVAITVFGGLPSDSTGDVEGPATNGSMSGTEVASKTIELTDQRLSHTLRGSPNCSLEDSAVNQSHIEIDGGKFSDEPDNRRDSGIDVEGPATNGSIPGTEVASKIFELTEQRSQMTSTPQNVIRNYNINIYGSHLITIGDTTSATQGGTEPIKEENTTIYHDYHDTDIAAQEKRNQESAFSHGEQSTDNSLSGPILLHTSEEEGPATAPCTSSLGHSSYHEPNLNIAMICDGLGNMILDDQDNNGDLNQLAFSGEKSTFL